MRAWIVEDTDMDAHVEDRWTANEFVEWMSGPSAPEGRWELVGGVPVRMMVNVRWGHSAAVGNIMRHLGNRLAGKPCRAHSESFAFETGDDQIRYPDVLVSCTKDTIRDTRARDVKVVIEVLSDGMRTFDKSMKLLEYQTVPSVAHILFAETGLVEVTHFVRHGDEWRRHDYGQFEDWVALEAVDAGFTLRELYEDIDLPPPAPRFRIVRDDE